MHKSEGEEEKLIRKKKKYYIYLCHIQYHYTIDTHIMYVYNIRIITIRVYNAFRAKKGNSIAEVPLTRFHLYLYIIIFVTCCFV